MTNGRRVGISLSRGLAAILIGFGLRPPPTAMWQRDFLIMGIWFLLINLELVVFTKEKS